MRRSSTWRAGCPSSHDDAFQLEDLRRAQPAGRGRGRRHGVVMPPYHGATIRAGEAALDAGATGPMPSGAYPDLLRPIVDDHAAGRREAAAAAYDRVLPLINYENRQCGLLACKVLMKEGGVIRSDLARHPIPPLHPA